MPANDTQFSKRGGRPRSENPRLCKIAGKFSEAEYVEVCSKIAGAGLTKSEAVRLLLLGEPFPVRLAPELGELYAKLQPLQSNLNQIARWMNTTQVDGMSAQNAHTLAQNIERTYKLIRRFRDQLLAAGTGKSGGQA